MRPEEIEDGLRVECNGRHGFVVETGFEGLGAFVRFDDDESEEYVEAEKLEPAPPATS